MDTVFLKRFLRELEISDADASVIFETLEKIQKNQKAYEIFSAVINPYIENAELDYKSLKDITLPALYEIIDAHEYEINLAVLFSLAPYSEHFYLEKGFSRKIWINSLLDLKWKMMDCIDINGFVGIRSASLPWFERWFFGTRYAFHRLQFEINPSKRSYKSEKFDIKVGDPLISVHIPSTRNGIKFDKENRDISYRQAKEYYSKLLGIENPVFSCASWLLAPIHKEILPESSNIRSFGEEFEIDIANPNSWHLTMLFGTEKLPETKDLPEKTSIQRAYKKFMLEGGAPQSALGYRYFEE